MKLAREIIEEINPFIDDRHNSEGFNVMEHVESLIAAKLEPVRELVQNARSYLPDCDMLKINIVGDTHIGQSAFAMDAALALLEEGGDE